MSHDEPYKICPQCQQPAVLTASQCGRCGRQYRTQFVPPQQTQDVPAPLVRSYRMKPILAVGMVAALLGIATFAGMRFQSSRAIISVSVVGAWSDNPQNIATLYIQQDGTFTECGGLHVTTGKYHVIDDKFIVDQNLVSDGQHEDTGTTDICRWSLGESGQTLLLEGKTFNSLFHRRQGREARLYRRLRDQSAGMH